MIYTELTKKAIKIMFDTHKLQVDKSGLPYVFHPYEVASKLDDEYSVCVALLHDVVEDGDLTFDDLSKDFPSEVIEALRLLTHDSSVDYFDYVNNIKCNPIARRVKLSDLEHNMTLSRLDSPTESDFKRVEKYKRAYSILKNY